MYYVFAVLSLLFICSLFYFYFLHATYSAQFGRFLSAQPNSHKHKYSPYAHHYNLCVAYTWQSIFDSQLATRNKKNLVSRDNGKRKVESMKNWKLLLISVSSLKLNTFWNVPDWKRSQNYKSRSICVCVCVMVVRHCQSFNAQWTQTNCKMLTTKSLPPRIETLDPMRAGIQSGSAINRNKTIWSVRSSRSSELWTKWTTNQFVSK